MALALQVRYSGLLRREPAFAFGHKVSGPRQLFPDDQLGMGFVSANGCPNADSTPEQGTRFNVL